MKYLGDLHRLTGRAVIAYYSGWLHQPGIEAAQIRGIDLDGFMACLHGVDCSQGLDLVLHTPGGESAATLAITRYLKEKFARDIRVIVPHTAMSGGTLIGLAAERIVMAKHSSIGPIDPQLGNKAANNLLSEFERAHREVGKDPSRLSVWALILRKYEPAVIEYCREAVAWTREYALEILRDSMLAGRPDAAAEARRIVNRLTKQKHVKDHSRPIGYREGRDIGLTIDLLEDDQQLQDAVLLLHHAYNYTLASTGVCKVTENHLGKGIAVHVEQPHSSSVAA